MITGKRLKTLLFITVLVFSLLITACGGGGDKACKTCVDSDLDGFCDVCKKEIPKKKDDIVLIEGGVAKFSFVIGADVGAAVEDALSEEIVSAMDTDHGIKIDVIREGTISDTKRDTEILIGEVKNRGDKYAKDGQKLGKNGYSIEIVDTKIVVYGGSDDALIDAIYELADGLFSADPSGGLKMTVGDEVHNPQNDYKITSVKISGNDMKDYKIAAPITDPYYYDAAVALQDDIYERTGMLLEIVDIDLAPELSIVINHSDTLSDEKSFVAAVNGNRINVDCAYDNRVADTVREFAAMAIFTGEGDVVLSGELYTKDISVVYYDDFGAKGDGKTDDFKAIYDTHVFANISGQTVKATPRKTYYICEARIEINGVMTVTTVPVRTNTDWQGAYFIIDDTELETRSGGKNRDMAMKHVFTVIPDEDQAMFKITDKQLLSSLGAINGETTHIDLGLDFDAMIIPYYKGHKIYRRRGYSQFAGADQHEIIILERDGRIKTEETPLSFHYNSVDYIEVYRIDPDRAVTVKNGNFKTLDTRENQKVNGVYGGTYIRRGINVTRAYTTIENIKHEVENGFTLQERINGYEGNTTNGFFTADNTSYVTIRNCLIPARMSYNGSSTYNLNAVAVNKLVIEDCVQTNFWIEIDPYTYEIKNATEIDDNAIGRAKKANKNARLAMHPYTVDGIAYNLYYGFNGSNYCKNFEYINSTLSRMDAHAGMYNGKVINTNIADLELTGYGNFLFENSNFYPYRETTPLLFLRSDYGYSWDGEITVRNVNAHVYEGYTLQIVNNPQSNWYFGYTCAFPSLTIDNLDLYSMETDLPLAAGTNISIANFSGYRKHLVQYDAPTSVSVGVVDANKNGTIDEPVVDINRDGIVDDRDKVDLDGDGVVGETSFSYADCRYNADGSENRKGIEILSMYNVNLTKPPKYIKVLNNDGVDGNGGYKFIIPQTAGMGISDGSWYDDKETFGGFFGDTKFYYGTGENDYLVGTGKDDTSGNFTFR